MIEGDRCSITNNYNIHGTNQNVDISEECADGKEYVDCANMCDMTCRQRAGLDECVSDACIPGCRCPEGMLLDDGQCVEQCPCYDDDENKYAVGQSVPSDNQCEVWCVPT